MFASAAVTTIALASITTVLFGVDVWTDFFAKGLPVQNRVLADPDLRATPFYPTIFMNVRGLDSSYAVAMAAQAVFSAFAIAVAVWAFGTRRDADPDLLAALFLACTICASPYLLAYDVLPLTFAAIGLLASGKLDATGRRLAQFAFWLPTLQLVCGAYHVPGPALVAPAFVAYLVVRFRALPPRAALQA